MALDRISLTDFRNHGSTELGDTAQFNLLLGENGAGKTNILEALSLLAPGRGLRRAALCDMVRNGSDAGFGVGASLLQDGEAVRLATYSESANPGRRRVRINGAESSATSLGEWLAVTWLTPAMDGLFTGAATWTGWRLHSNQRTPVMQPATKVPCANAIACYPICESLRAPGSMPSKPKWSSMAPP